MKRLLLVLLFVLLALAGTIAINTFRQGSRQAVVDPIPVAPLDEAAAASRLAGAIRAPTIFAADDPGRAAGAFRALHDHLRTSYPRVHSSLTVEVVGDYSLLYTWRGRDASLRPVLLMAHQDVVPVEAGTEKDWPVDPFAGEVLDGYVWGRGAWDDKGSLIAQLEAVEMLLAAGFQPARTLYLAFGADEEAGGSRGAARIAALLAERTAALEFVLDEGLLITDGVMPGLAKPLALIGVAEKGHVTIVLRSEGEGGHASMPPASGAGAIARLSRALTRLDERPMPAAVRGVAREMLETVAPELRGLNRVALSNLWLFEPLVRRQLERGPGTNAVIRTTTAITMAVSGTRENVLPLVAEATVNFRILPGDTIASVVEHVRVAVDDAQMEIAVRPGGAEPSEVSPTNAAPYALVVRALREVVPGTLAAPGLMIGATDARHFQPLTDNIYRFSPIRATPADLSRLHGTGERLSTGDLANMVRWYRRVIELAAGT